MTSDDEIKKLADLAVDKRARRTDLIDLAGQRFGRWRVIALSGKRSGYDHFWLCECACGTTRLVKGSSLRCGDTKSCGCLNREAAAARATRHGHAVGAKSRAYRAWNSMIQRCTNPRAQAFKDYGGRGITVCERWRTFVNFLADMGEPPKGLTLDRIENDGDYEPGNCRWATRSEQRVNQRRSPTRALAIAKNWADRRAAFGRKQGVP